MQKEQCDGVVHPEDFAAGQGSLPRFDFATAKVRHDLVAHHSSAQAMVSEFRVKRAQFNPDEILRYRVHRMDIGGFFLPASLQERFVIACQQSQRVPISMGDFKGSEPVLEVSAQRCRVDGRQGRGLMAHLCPSRIAGHHRAAAKKSAHSRGEGAGIPTRKGAPRHRREPRRCFGRWRRSFRYTHASVYEQGE